MTQVDRNRLRRSGAGLADMLGWPDLALGAAFAVLMALELIDLQGRVTTPVPVVVTAAIVAVLAVTVVTRRRAPLTSYLVNGLGLSLYIGLGYPGDVYPWTNAVVLYAVATYGTSLQALLGLVTGAAGIAWYFSVTPESTQPVDPTLIGGFWLLFWVAGQLAASRRKDAEQKQRAQEQITADVVAAERARMAGELHDVVGHALNVMVMHASAARRLADRQPQAVAAALDTVEATGRTALGELDHLLGLLTETGADGRRAPTAGLADLPALCARVGGAGLDVRLTREGDGPALPAAVDLAAYRIAQEALTNVVKHAHAATVDVRVRRDPTSLELEVVDDGKGPPRQARAGRGLTGLTERARTLGGTVTAGQGVDGGYTLRAVLPLEPTP